MIAACAALGALNGVLVARLALPSLAVTLGTMGAFRGLAFILGLERATRDFYDPTHIGSEQGFGGRPYRLSLSWSSRSRSALTCGAPLYAAAMPSD